VNNLQKRSLTGIVFVAVLLGGTIFHPVSFILVFGALLFFTQLEFYRLIEKAGFSPQKTVGLTLGILLFATCAAIVNGFIPAQLCLLFIPMLIFLFLFEVLRNRNGALQNSALTLLGFVYIAIPFSLLNFIVFPGFPTNTAFHPWILAGVFFIVWMYDSTAYLFGTKFGKHKMCKTISPKKSWEGFIAGTVFAIVMGILNAVIFQSLSMLSWMIVALLAVVFGTFGDIFESKIKRELNIKDSGNILPGHGGFLDRFDSLLFAIPVVFIWLILAGNI
jgi:phosphatidate cytidylyltransferase